MKTDLRTLTYRQLINLAHRVASDLAATPPGVDRAELRRMHVQIADEHWDRLWVSKQVERRQLAT